MTCYWKVALCILALVIAASAPARAETTKEFLAKCKTDAKACQDYILAVRLISMMDKAKRDLVCLPKDYVTAEVIKTVTDWMSDHPDLSNDAPNESIEKGYQAMYPNTKACQDTYIDADPFPATTEKFLAYCAMEPKGAKETCYDEIIGVGLKLKLDDPNSFCSVNADPGDKTAYHEALEERDSAIRGWLAEHAELGAKPRWASITAAYIALYPPPCTNKRAP